MGRVLGMLVVSGLLVADTAAAQARRTEDDARRQRAADAVRRALPLLQTSADVWYEERRCPSCHHQGLGMMAVSLARERGFPIDEARLSNQIRLAGSERPVETELQLLGEPSVNEAIGQTYRLLGLAAAGTPEGPDYRLVAHMLGGKQHVSGRWSSASHRPPLEDSEVTATALALRALDLFSPEPRVAEMAERIGRARRWLFSADPKDTEDRVMQILGLLWAGTESPLVHPLAERLGDEQRADGGWQQIPLRESDAYATGQALAVLQLTAAAKGDSVARGVDFLIDSQHEDGSWLVTTRRTDMDPGLPYFETGFPHGPHQFISYAGSAWATMALILAATEGSHEALSGRDPRSTDLRPAQINPVRDVADLPALLRIAVSGSPEDLARALEDGADPSTATESGLTALHCASHRPEMVAALLAAGAQPDAATSTGHTALLLASGYDGAQESVRLLLAAGADVHASTLDGVTTPSTALVRAVQRGDEALVAVLLERGARVAGGEHQISPIHVATWQDDEAMVTFLLDRGALVDEVLAVPGVPAWTPLMFAAADGLVETARVLVDRGADLAFRDELGRTALMISVGTADLGSSAMVDLLLRSGADPTATTPDGETALSLARRYGVEAAAAALAR